MNETHFTEKLHRVALSPAQQQQLYSMIATLLKNAIEVRAPRNRPPGKAGLKAEKSYYRLLYLEQNFQATISTQESIDPHGPANNGILMTAMVRQLADLPELQSEILAGFKTALAEVTNRSLSNHISSKGEKTWL